MHGRDSAILASGSLAVPAAGACVAKIWQVLAGVWRIDVEPFVVGLATGRVRSQHLMSGMRALAGPRSRCAGTSGHAQEITSPELPTLPLIVATPSTGRRQKRIFGFQFRQAAFVRGSVGGIMAGCGFSSPGIAVTSVARLRVS